MGGLNVAFVIWRELFEAILIVGIVYAYLMRQVPPARARRLALVGIGIGVTLSLLLGIGFQLLQATLSADTLDHFQTAVLLVCAGFMTHMCLWMQRHGRHLRQDLEASLAGALASVSAGSVIGLIALAIAREGFEAVVYLYGMSVAGGAFHAALGGLAGAALAAASGWAAMRGIRVLNPRLFFRVTGVFLLLTASSLVVNATGRLLQAGWFAGLADPVWDSSMLLDDRSLIGRGLASITGYQATPALLTVLVYTLYWVVYFASKRLMAMKHAAPAAAVAALALVALLHPGRAAAADAAGVAPGDKLKLKASGYGDLQFRYFDFSSDESKLNGAPKAARASFDTTRFAVEFEGYYLPYDVAFEAEVEFEHGGTGGAKEQKASEPGTYNSNAERGGETYLEEFYLKKNFGADVAAAAGRIMVGVGLVSLYNRPTDYLGVQRDETEVHIIPETWNEMGVQLAAQLGDWAVLGQVINGLDSSGFGSSSWVAAGHQQAFEQTTATDLAGAVRADYGGLSGTVAGASAYYGGTTRNRPGVDVDQSPVNTITAPVLITDVHARVNLESWRGSGEVLWGRLQHAAEITSANSGLSESRDAARTPVAEQALGYWAEAGYDVGPLLAMASDRRLEPFGRFDYYNTMYKVTGGTVPNPLFERRLVTLGVAYTVGNALFAKFDISQRSFGAKHLRKEDTAELGLGFIL